jgi:TonB family protein
VRRFAPDFRQALIASAILHAGLVVFNFIRMPSFGPSGPVEIDLTMPFIGAGAPKLAAPKRLDPKAALPSRPVDEPVPEKQPAKVEPPKEWTLPGKATKTVVAPVEETPPSTQGGKEGGQGIAADLGGTGPGFGHGVPNGVLNPGAPPGTVFPQLLNRDEVLANLRKYYPERERIAGHEGKVIVDIHLSAEGAISGVDIVESAGKLFDAAAVKVAHLMRFSPARTPAGPVAAKVRKTMQFRLED